MFSVSRKGKYYGRSVAGKTVYKSYSYGGDRESVKSEMRNECSETLYQKREPGSSEKGR